MCVWRHYLLLAEETAAVKPALVGVAVGGWGGGGACQERHWSHLEIFSAHGNLSHVQKISGAGDWLAFQPHQSPGVRHQRLAGPAPPPCHLFSNIFPSCTLSSPDHQKKDNWMVVWTLGQRHNGHPTILKIVSSARARARACVCVCVCVCLSLL